MSKTFGIIKRDKNVLSTSMTRDFDFVFKRGKGCNIWDTDGKKYLDFAAGIAVLAAGHVAPPVATAIKKQLANATHCAFPDFYAEAPLIYAETLLGNMPKPLNNGRIFLTNSGTESVEAAVKLAKWNKRGSYMIAFDHCFHGRTMGSLSMTNSKAIQREGFDPFLPVKHVPYPYWYRMKMEPEECSNHCLNALDRMLFKLGDDCSGVFMEPIQGEGGYVVPPKSFVRGVRKLCDEHDVLLCDDEIQAGCFRTGKFLAIENFGVVPDIVAMAKGIGGGLPLGAIVAKRELMTWPPGAHSNTYGGNLLASAAGKATLDYLKKKKAPQNAVKTGNHIMKRLNEMKDRYEYLGDVRGIGLMIGAEIVHDKKDREPAPAEREFIIHRCFDKGLILIGAGKSVIRFCPALIITKAEADHGLDIFEHALKMLHEHKKKGRKMPKAHPHRGHYT